MPGTVLKFGTLHGVRKIPAFVEMAGQREETDEDDNRQNK